MAEDARGVFRLLEPRRRDVDVEPPRDDVARLRVFEAVEQHAENAEALRHDAAGVAGMHALGQHIDGEVANDRAAQRRRHPQLLIVAASAVETDHETRRADARLQQVDVGGEIGRAALLAAFDDHDDPRVRDVLLLQRADRADRGEDRVAVVGAAAAVEAAVAQHRRPRPQPLLPPDHGRLLVEVPVHEHGRGGVAIDLDEEYRRAVVDLVHLDGEAGDVLLLDPALGQGDGLMHVSVRSPLGIEEGRLVGDGDVTLKSRDDRRAPDVVDALRDLVGIHRTAENSIPRGLGAVRKKELRRN